MQRYSPSWPQDDHEPSFLGCKMLSRWMVKVGEKSGGKDFWSGPVRHDFVEEPDVDAA